MRLLGVELRRALARRLVRILTLIVVLGIALAGIITAAKSQPPTQELERSRVAQIEACTRGEIDPPQIQFGSTKEDLANRQQFFDEFPPGSRTLRRICEEGLLAGSRTFELTGIKGVLEGVTGPLVVIAVVIGASLIAAEWRSGMLSTTLAWEPRRILLMLTKAAAAFIVVVAFYVVMQAFLAGVLWLVATTRGTTAGAGAAFARTVAGEMLRATLLVGCAGLIGFAIGSIGKNTAAALGAAFVYLVVFEQILINTVAWIRPWLIISNGVLFVANIDIGAPGDTVFLEANAVKAGLRLVLYAAGLVVVATAMFKKRDVLT